TDQQRPLTDWATGKTQTVPSFFSKPLGDAADKEGCDCAYVSLPASEDDLKPCSDRVLVAEAAVGARPEPHGSVEPGVLPVELHPHEAVEVPVIAHRHLRGARRGGQRIGEPKRP